MEYWICLGTGGRPDIDHPGERSYYDEIYESREDLLIYQRQETDPTIIHVIEKQAYDNLKKENTKLREALEEIKGFGYIPHADHDKLFYRAINLARTALGEKE